MDRAPSGKKLQKEGKVQEALTYYKKRYHEALEEGDAFLSSLYLDEVVQTLIIGKEDLSFERLRDELVSLTGVEDLSQPEAREQAKLDLQVALRKRFPEKFVGTRIEESR